jgi:hypothetical protein
VATWIAHLRIGEKLLESIPGLDQRYFAYGSLAPDCGRHTGDNQEFIPPKEISHYVMYAGERPIFEDLRFYREHLQGLDRRDEPERYCFLLAYFIHLTVDGLWYEWIAEASQRDYADLIAHKGHEAWWMMKDDWYGLDVHYTLDHQESLFWREILPQVDFPLLLPFQDRSAVDEQIEYIKGLYSNPPLDLIDRDHFPYLNRATMDRFVGEATIVVETILEIIATNGLVRDANCSLDLLPDTVQTPYAAPIGDR